MRMWIGMALVAAGLGIAAPAMAGSAGLVQGKAQAATRSDATDPGARRVHRRHVARPSVQPYPVYYARPVYYRPYPYGVPAPFFLGFAYLPYW